MGGNGFPVMYVLVLAIILVAGVIAVFGGRATRKAFEEYARARGWEYTRSDNALVRSFPQVEPFGRGSGRRARNVLRHRTGAGTGYSFDYQYTVHSGVGNNRSSTTYRFHVVSLDLPQPLPRLLLRPEVMMDGVTKFFGAQDVQFESEEFNRAWFVQSEHLPAAHDVVHPRMMEWLMTLSRARFVIEGTTLYTHISGSQKRENIDPLLALLQAFVDQVPPFVWDKAQSEYPQRGL